MSGVIAFVFARGGSKGLPGKNLRVLGDRPLVAHAIARGLAAPSIDRVVVSSEDPEIARTAVAWGAEAPWLRPAELASDDAPEWLAWQHAVKMIQSSDGPFELFVSIPATAPLRTVEDVEAAIDLYRSTDCDLVLTGTPSARSPWFNQVRMAESGFVSLSAQDGSGVERRQDAPELFDLTTVCYVTTPEFVLGGRGVLDGRTRLLEIPKHRALDIDDAYDFAVAEALYPRVMADPADASLGSR